MSSTSISLFIVSTMCTGVAVWAGLHWGFAILMEAMLAVISFMPSEDIEDI